MESVPGTVINHLNHNFTGWTRQKCWVSYLLITFDSIKQFLHKAVNWFRSEKWRGRQVFCSLFIFQPHRIDICWINWIINSWSFYLIQLLSMLYFFEYSISHSLTRTLPSISTFSTPFFSDKQNVVSNRYHAINRIFCARIPIYLFDEMH